MQANTLDVRCGQFTIFHSTAGVAGRAETIEDVLCAAEDYLMDRNQELSMNLNIPDSLPSPEATVYEDSQVTVTLVDEAARGGEICMNIYLENHDEFEEIVPGDTTHCSLYDNHGGGPSRISELPSQMYKLVTSAVDQVVEKHDLALTNPQNGYGVCHTCMGEENECGLLAFSVSLEEA